MSAKRDDTVKVDATGQPYVEIVPGIRADVVSNAEAERCTIVVCGSYSHFTDDVWTTCAHCAAPICHRPYSPTTPPKICLACARTYVEQASQA